MAQVRRETTTKETTLRKDCLLSSPGLGPEQHNPSRGGSKLGPAWEIVGCPPLVVPKLTCGADGILAVV